MNRFQAIYALRANLAGMVKPSTSAGPVTVTKFNRGKAVTTVVPVTPVVQAEPHSHGLHQGVHRRGKTTGCNAVPRSNQYGRTDAYSIGSAKGKVKP